MDDLDLDGGEIGGTVQWEPVPDWFGGVCRSCTQCFLLGFLGLKRGNGV